MTRFGEILQFGKFLFNIWHFLTACKGFCKILNLFWAIFCAIRQIFIVCKYCKCSFFFFFFKKMGQSRPLFVYFLSFLVTISIQIEKSIDDVLGIWTRGHRMVGADFFTNAPFQSVTLCSRQCAAYLTFQCLYLSISLFSTFDLWIKMSQTESSFWSKFDTKRRRKEDPSIWFSDTHKKNFFFFLRWWKNKYWINKFLCHPNELNFQLFVFPVLIRSFLSQKHLFN